MITVFIEYKIDPARQEEGLRLLAGMEERMIALGASRYRCWEGCDQPGLYVEAFEVEDASQYERIKEERLRDESFCACVAGGAAKLHVWAFREARLPGSVTG
jgi:hypothetical protein